MAISLISQDLRRISPVEGWCPRPVLPHPCLPSPQGFTPFVFLNKKHMGKTTGSKESLRVLSTVLIVRPKKYGMMGIFLNYSILPNVLDFFCYFFPFRKYYVSTFSLEKMGFIITKLCYTLPFLFPASKSINWIYPPPTGKWRIIRINNYWNYNPGGDCGWFGSVGPRMVQGISIFHSLKCLTLW